MESLDWNINTVAHVIEVSVAPVFLLAGISGLLVVLTNRLGRAIDRSRMLKAAELEPVPAAQSDSIQREKTALIARIRFVNAAISMAVVSAILVCLVIVTLFLGSLVQFNVAAVIASLFIVCMLFLSLAFFMFFLEVMISIRTLKTTLVPHETFHVGRSNGIPRVEDN